MKKVFAYYSQFDIILVMKTIDRNKLQTKMVEQGIKMKDLATELCVSYQCVYNKVKLNKDFTENDIYVLFNLFGSDIFYFDFGYSQNDNRKKKKL